MKKLNPIERSKYINEQYKKYLRSSFAFGGEELQKLFLEQLEKERLFKGPYVHIEYPFQRGKNIDSLISEGVVCKSFRNLDDINFTRPLYSHQEDAIKLIKKGRSAIVTTGTGSGKTECFLYPILNELLADVESGNREIGIRAIFLYPMNALVNDQIDRIRKILKNCPDITFGFFTGETKETATAKDRKVMGEENGIIITDNELVSRQEIRNNPPHLLFTNYSMLEYLLIRPNDYAIFDSDRLNNWKYVVLDEAHSYNGSLGIELSMLLRRLTGLAKKKPQFILTSATLGEQGKSEKDIVEFAHNLTSSDYSVDDIIFSKRIKMNRPPEYRISGDDYGEIKLHIDSIDYIKNISKKYISSEENDVKSILFDLLSIDKNVYELSELLSSGSKDFYTLYQAMKEHLTQEQLIDLIDVINIAEKDGIGLFDLKYHSFVRPLSGAYVTFGKEPKLSLTKTNEIEDLKAFEIGNCKYCNTPYIIGKIQKDEETQLNYLFQNKEVDIYENYGNESYVQIDYFLIQEPTSEFDEDEDSDNEIIDKYDICAKCGEIHLAANLNAEKCKCGDEFRFFAYRVLPGKEKKETLYNNVSQCPCCGHKGRGGVVKALNIGKDEGTSLIAQMLYEAIDEEGEGNKKVAKLSFKPIVKSIEEKNDIKVKQYLTFSDSRQQASFAALFFDSNHVRMLRKRLIWEILKENNFKNLSVDELSSYLSDYIKTKDLFDNDMGAHKNAWAAVLVDLLKVDGLYDGEGLGLYYFDLDIKSTLEMLEDEDIEEAFEGKLTREELNTLIQVVFGIFKTVPAINYTKSTLTPEEVKDILEYRRFNNFVMLSCPKTQQGIKSFLPINQKENKTVRYVMKVMECNSDRAKNILEMLFNLLVQCGDVEGGQKILLKHDQKDAYQIDARQYIIRNYKTSKYYQCSKCGNLTPYSIKGICPMDKCNGKLNEVDPDIVLANNYYRYMYMNKKIERIVIKEHTAQLDKKQAKEYQNEFKNKKINILSCSTTFEMGIDIGGLETVYMRNVPPSPANYVQRAGRAGRRKDSAAYILTYCGSGSHDYTYFSEPEKMISGIINPPYFDVLNRKIIIRHLMATSLGFFFRKYPEYYKNIDSLVISGNGIEKFKDYITSHPEDLKDYINNKILPESKYSEYRDFKWLEEMEGEDEKLTFFVDSIREMVKEFEKAKELALAEERYKDADYYARQLKNLKQEEVIKYLSRFCVIPKYGFPVDVVDLQIYENGMPVTKYDLNRDLRIAISEYAPESEVIVDGNKYTSQYISLRKDHQFQRNYFTLCSTCKKINLSLSKGSSEECKYCGNTLSWSKGEYYIEPIYGFKTGVTKESTRMKPKRTYSGEVSYVGNGKIDDKHLVLGNALGIETSSDDELLVMNKSGFYMCPICGFGKIPPRNQSNGPQTLEKHKNYRQFDCTCDQVDYLKLGHKFRTDVARFTIPILDASEKSGYPQALSFLYAFLEGISLALDIERTDIDGVLELNNDWKSFDVLLYDAVPGGAGHVKRLLDKHAIVKSLNAALDKVGKTCCDENTSCYSCLRNYYNQSYHNKLKRKLAIDVIKRLLFEINQSSEIIQNERWHWDSNNNITNKKMKLQLLADGRNPGSETPEEIWTDLLDDCYTEDEIKLISEIKNKCPEIISKPYYNKSAKIVETGEIFTANLLWDTKYVVLLLNDNQEFLKLAKKTGWSVYSTIEGFDVDEFLERIGE